MPTHHGGGPKTTTAALRARGSVRVKFRGREPIYPGGDPAMPARVKDDPLATQHWNEMLPILRAARTLDQSSGPIVATLACALAAADRFAADFAAMDRALMITDTTVTADGRTRTMKKPNPLLRLAHQNALVIVRLCETLGLTPTASARAHAAPLAPPSDPFDRFLDSAPRK